jgi:hypothetical protein
MEFKKTLTTESGAPVTDNQNSRSAGPRDPRSNVVRLAVILAFFIAAPIVGSCSAGGTHQTPPPNPDAPNLLMDFTGVWKGTSTSSMNAAKVKISFDMERDGNKLKGSYRCAPLNAICRNNIQRGWVNGQTGARGYTVSMEDTSGL